MEIIIENQDNFEVADIVHNRDRLEEIRMDLIQGEVKSLYRWIREKKGIALHIFSTEEGRNLLEKWIYFYKISQDRSLTLDELAQLEFECLIRKYRYAIQMHKYEDMYQLYNGLFSSYTTLDSNKKKLRKKMYDLGWNTYGMSYVEMQYKLSK